MASQAGLRDSFLRKHPNLRYGLGEWRQYRGGIWEPVSELAVKAHMQELIPRDKLTSSLVNSVTELLRATTNIPDRLFDANTNILTFDNTCLDLTSFNTVSHAPEYYSTTKLGFSYDPQAESGAWTKFLEICPHRNFLQEFAGYCLTPETKYELAVWLHGPAGGGKSTFITGLESMLGPKCCVLGLNEIEKSSFALSQIMGKTLAISTEQPSHYVKSAYAINAIVSGETVLINRKFRDHVAVTPHVKLLWAMNDLPQLGPGSAGIFRRILPVFWPALEESARDPEIKEEIMRSGMAVVNWSLEGLKRLRARGRFQIPPELIVSREAYKTQSDVTLCFIEDACITGDDCEIPASELYELYDKWTTKNGHRALASNRFAADLERLGFSKVKRSIGNFWSGLEEKPDFPDIILDDSV